MTEECFAEVEPLLGTKAACIATGRPRATHYRRLRPSRCTPPKARPSPPNKLSGAEEEAVLATLNSPRFVDTSPIQAYYVLLDEGTYIASVSTFYGAPRAKGQVRERRHQAAPCYRWFGTACDQDLVGHVGHSLLQGLLGGGHQAVLLGQHLGASLHRLGQPPEGMGVSSVQRSQQGLGLAYFGADRRGCLLPRPAIAASTSRGPS